VAYVVGKRGKLRNVPVDERVAFAPNPVESDNPKGANGRAKKFARSAPSPLPRGREDSRHLAYTQNTAKQDAVMGASAFRTLDFSHGREGDVRTEMTHAEAANTAPFMPEHVAERKKSAPRVDRKTLLPVVRTRPGTLAPNWPTTPIKPTAKNPHAQRNNRLHGSKDPYIGGTAPRGAIVGVVPSPGMGARYGKRVTPETREDVTENARSAGAAACDRATERVRDDAKSALSAAIGREREALERGDQAAASAARAEIRKLRKLTKFKA
jgi:hypothetical protein